eukprot:CAMPEP_0173458312 /NCGR_PEP_ID=MMETSP1357-20121228/59367_1 /TAXON_ID=77926 /ORGANISM="Hemiselmis rufescens, Strain PCC563" /LENGTH=126 /DNA_ID=CAMNT_0014425673 /DNA_START=1 /DNA_END=377 /DNA_ORIENTATION=+
MGARKPPKQKPPTGHKRAGSALARRAPVSDEMDSWVEAKMGGRLTLVRNQLFTSPSGIRRDYSQYLVRKHNLGVDSLPPPAPMSAANQPRAFSATFRPPSSDGLPARPRSSLAYFDPDAPKEKPPP